jgi:hypothetical protein
MRKNTEVPTPVSPICDLYFLCSNIIHVLFCFVLFCKDINYYSIIHVTGHGLFSQAKGRPKGDSCIKLPCSDSLQEKMLELRKDFRLHNNLGNAFHLYKGYEQICFYVFRGMVH